jgi:mono/diheme cytochrome c family protein
MWGTRRIGPDLARETGKCPNDWQLVHLYNPRYVVPDSIMPGYSWLFQGGATKPSQDALDLIAYLNTLGRPAMKAAVDRIALLTPIDTRSLAWMSPTENDLEEGKSVFVANCSGCHGADGRGNSPGGRSLRPLAFNLADFRLSPALVWNALGRGVPGSAMPAWNELPGAEFKAVADYVLSIGRTPDLRPEEQLASAQTLMLAGQRIFDTHCTRCHGENGAGDGPEAGVYMPRRANFHQLRPSYQGAAHVIQNGVSGSGMPAWPFLTRAEIQAVTYYMRSLYQGTSPPERPATNAASSDMEEMQ